MNSYINWMFLELLLLLFFCWMLNNKWFECALAFLDWVFDPWAGTSSIRLPDTPNTPNGFCGTY